MWWRSSPDTGSRWAWGIALLIAAVTFVLAIFEIAAVGGEATGLSGASLAIAFACLFVLGSLMTIGIGMYAPTMIVISLMGMNPAVAFPIMMGASAFLMPVAGLRFLEGRTLWAEGGPRAGDRRHSGRADRGVHRGVDPAELHAVAGRRCRAVRRDPDAEIGGAGAARGGRIRRCRGLRLSVPRRA